MTDDAPAVRWALFAVISAIFFLISAGTFSSLGVVLPFMIHELSWTWSQAGTGFSLLALTVGLASTVPAWILRRLGIKATYGIGGVIMASGFALFALTNGLQLYFVAAALLGLGFASCATVPGVYLLNGWMPEKRSATIGAFMTAGGLGAVAGPLAARWIIAATDSWRMYWWAMAASMLALTALALIFVRTPPPEAVVANAATAPAAESRPQGVYRTSKDWRFRDAIRTPQFWIISIAMTTTLLCVLTSSSWAFTHMGTLGVSASVAAGVLSADGAVSALSRALGGALATRIDPKRLLVAALVGETIGIAALSVADNWVAIAIFAVADGFGFGMCFFATAMLLVNYFGPSENPEIFGTLNLITTAAMIGPATAGFFADKFGGFAGVFQGYVAVMIVMVIITAAMRPPRLPAQ
ncbi:MAG: MFS transporter [Gammaproteobacteria bacterium]|nr:MFS transporter [Gammaproteobacteria bacterium]